MWTIDTRSISSSSVIGVSINLDAKPITFAEVFREWDASHSFRADWSSALRNIPLDAYCWEMPPLTKASLSEPFECIFVESPSLGTARADPGPFAEHFRKGKAAVTFESLGKDAILIAPCPDDRNAIYSHLAAFLRTAPAPQSSHLWQVVAQAFERRVGDSPVWLSTAGLGVSWLHVRLDSRPKYYRHRPYTSPRYWGHHTRALSS